MNSIDLTKQAPRSPRHRLGGYSLLARMIDKGRATLENMNGEYHYACPLDQHLLDFKSVGADEFLAVIRTASNEADAVAWFVDHGTPKSADEISTWSDQVDSWSMYADPEKREWFIAECGKLGLDPTVATLADYLEADDAASFPAVA